MREILFRGKRKDNGEWIEGSLLNFRENTYIIPHDSDYCYDDIEKFAFDVEYFEVILETVGQYTGLTDKNGVKIFEGDIIHCIGGEFYNGYHEVDENIVVKDITDGVYLGEVELLEVIGNIMDNSELLEGYNENE